MAQRYIPGLTPRPVDTGPTQAGATSAPIDVPQELIDDFTNGLKQPISALMEYSAMRRLVTTFREVPVKNYTMNNKFANQCTVAGKGYPQGADDTKKKAKTKAALIAFNVILGIDTFEDYGEVDPSKPSSRGKTTAGNEEVVYSRRGVEQTGEYEAPPQKRDANSIFNKYLEHTGKRGSIEVGDNPGPFGFIAKVMISGRTVAENTGNSKKNARTAALNSALETLDMERALYQQKEALEDQIAKLCYQKLDELIRQSTQCHEVHTAKHSFAAFIVKRAVDDKGEIVAFGTGNTCLSCENLGTDGRMLIDSYAVAVARKALLKYFYKEIKSYFEGSKVMSVFTEVGLGQFKLKDHITLHLYLNQPPPGDYRECLDIERDSLSPEQEADVQEGAHIPAFNDDLPGWFSVKNEDGLVEVVEEDQPPVQNFQELQEGGEDLLVMSCSDKLLLWNTVGLQGALFSNFLQPVYLASIILGQKYDHGHMARAVCCRLYDVLNKYLPEPYNINHPYLSTITMVSEEMDAKPTNLSINWSLGDDKPEIVDGFSGKVIDSSPFRSTKTPGPCSSRLCKAGFLFRYRDIGNIIKNRDMLQTPNYITSKELASDYQAAKRAFRNFTLKIGLGNWIQKPKEISQFQK